MIKVSKIFPDAKIPTRKFPKDAGADLYAYIGEDEHVEIEPFEYYVCPTGIKVGIPNGYVGLIFPKSGNNHLIGAGVVDSTYQGQVFVKIVNYHGRILKVSHLDPIGQLVILPVLSDEIEEVLANELYEEISSRGNTGGIVNQFREVELPDGRMILESNKPYFKGE